MTWRKELQIMYSLHFSACRDDKEQIYRSIEIQIHGTQKGFGCTSISSSEKRILLELQ